MMLIDVYLLEGTGAEMRELLGEGTPSPQEEKYDFFERSYNKRGLQELLDRQNQPRSGKNKRVLIRRVFETILWRRLEEVE